MTELKENLNGAFYHHVEYINEIENRSLSVSDFIFEYTLDLKQFFDYFKEICLCGRLFKYEPKPL